MGRLFFWLVAGCLFGAGVRCCLSLKETAWYNGFYYETASVEGKALDTFWEHASEKQRESVQGMALLQEENKAVFKNERLGRTEEGRLVTVKGNMYLAVPGGLLQGAFPRDGDKKGCVISSGTAKSCFGDEAVIGDTIRIKEERYTIRGIAEGRESFCLVQGSADAVYPYVRVEARGIPLTVLGQQMLAGFLTEAGGWVMEGNLYYGLGRLFLCLPLWFFFASIIMQMKRRTKKRWVKRSIPVLLAAGTAGLVCLSFRFSSDYIPGAWSDFAFFAQLWEEKQEMVSSLLTHPLLLADTGVLKGCAAGIALGLFATGMAVTSVFVEKKRDFL